MASRERRSRVAVALVAACMLLFQGWTGGFAMGAAALPQLDLFGNPLCITSHDAGPQEQGRNHTGLPECCAPGCTMFAPIVSGDRAEVSLAAPLSFSIGSVPASPRGLYERKTRHDPGRPRAPPQRI